MFHKVVLLVESKATRECRYVHNFLNRKETEDNSTRGLSVYRPSALPLSKTDPHRTVSINYVQLYEKKGEPKESNRGPSVYPYRWTKPTQDDTRSLEYANLTQ